MPYCPHCLDALAYAVQVSDTTMMNKEQMPGNIKKSFTPIITSYHIVYAKKLFNYCHQTLYRA